MLSKFAIDTNLYNVARSKQAGLCVVYILQNLLLILTYTTNYKLEYHEVRCVYPSKFAIDTNLYNQTKTIESYDAVVYILQNLLLILTYTTVV